MFPPVFVVRPPDGPAADWVRANVAYALAQTHAVGGRAELDDARLPELLLVEVLRLHLASAPAADEGWLAALHDPVLQPALALLHAEPERGGRSRRWRARPPSRGRCWTRGSARSSAARRSATSPSGACTSPRTCSPPPTSRSATIARRVGYDAEEAFSRAFKRSHGSAPTVWRSSHPLR